MERVFLNIASSVSDKKIYLVPIHKNYDDDFIQQVPESVKIIDNTSFEIAGLLAGINILRLAKFVNEQFTHKLEPICCINFSDTISTIAVSLLIKANVYYSWCHCSPFAFKESKFFLLYKILYKKFDNIVNLCFGQQRAFCKVFGERFYKKSKICFNLININEIKAKSKESLVIDFKYVLHVSRFDDRSKDFYTLIDGYSLLPESIKNEIKLLLIGDGQDRKKIEGYVCQKGLQKYVVFLGSQVNPYKYMTNAECCVLSSKTEGFSLVVCEALLCNGLVVSSDCVAGPSDILDEGKYGLLFDVGDSEMLSKQLYKILTDKELRFKLKESSERRVEEMNMNAMRAIVGLIK